MQHNKFLLARHMPVKTRLSKSVQFSPEFQENQKVLEKLVPWTEPQHRHLQMKLRKRQLQWDQMLHQKDELEKDLTKELGLNETEANEINCPNILEAKHADPMLDYNLKMKETIQFYRQHFEQQQLQKQKEAEAVKQPSQSQKKELSKPQQEQKEQKKLKFQQLQLSHLFNRFKKQYNWQHQHLSQQQKLQEQKWKPLLSDLLYQTEKFPTPETLDQYLENIYLHPKPLHHDWMNFMADLEKNKKETGLARNQELKRLLEEK